MSWRPVVGFEGLYEVSDDGRVRSLTLPTSAGRALRAEPLELKQREPRSDGYLCVALYDADGDSHTKFVHSLVAEAFIGKRPYGMECCHDDDNPGNNAVGNLRWDTPKGNQKDRIRHGTDVRGVKHPNAKLTDAQVTEIKTRLKAGAKGAPLAKDFCVSTTLISDIKNGKHRSWVGA